MQNVHSWKNMQFVKSGCIVVSVAGNNNFEHYVLLCNFCNWKDWGSHKGKREFYDIAHQFVMTRDDKKWNLQLADKSIKNLLNDCFLLPSDSQLKYIGWFFSGNTSLSTRIVWPGGQPCCVYLVFQPSSSFNINESSKHLYIFKLNEIHPYSYILASGYP